MTTTNSKRMTHNLHHGDSAVVLREYESNSIDAVVCDPPYGLSFMGKAWDKDVPAVEIFAECFRVLKPGGHLIAFGGSRTYHHTAMRVEQVGFEVRDQLLWLYGSGFPKSMDIGKAIDKDAGVERDVIGHTNKKAQKVPNKVMGEFRSQYLDPKTGRIFATAPATPKAQQWDGWGTAAKPAHEPAVLARKPLEGRVIDNVLEHGTGGLNVDGCRVGETGGTAAIGKGRLSKNTYGNGLSTGSVSINKGRWPANVCHDGSEPVDDILGDKARYFYCGKTSPSERNAGADRNTHPTVKPIALMRWLCRLVTPPNGVVLDPFMGSGSTGIAAIQEGFQFVGIEREAEYHAIATARIEHAIKQLMNNGTQQILL